MTNATPHYKKIQPLKFESKEIQPLNLEKKEAGEINYENPHNGIDL
jgi:hypothetical protein